MDSREHADIRLCTRRDEVLPHVGNGAGSDRELFATKATSRIKAGAIAGPLASSTEDGAAEAPTEDASSLPRTKILAVLKMAAIPMARGLGFVLLYSPALCALGATTLNGIFHVAPFTSVPLVGQLTASLAGAPVAALAVGAIAFVDFVLRRLPGLGRDQGVPQCLDEMALVVGALSSVFAMPLGFVMMPHLATEEFGVWYALAVTATGLGVLGGMLLCCLLIVWLVLL